METVDWVYHAVSNVMTMNGIVHVIFYMSLIKHCDHLCTLTAYYDISYIYNIANGHGAPSLLVSFSIDDVGPTWTHSIMQSVTYGRNKSWCNLTFAHVECSSKSELKLRFFPPMFDSLRVFVKKCRTFRSSRSLSYCIDSVHGMLNTFGQMRLLSCIRFTLLIPRCIYNMSKSHCNILYNLPTVLNFSDSSFISYWFNVKRGMLEHI